MDGIIPKDTKENNYYKNREELPEEVLEDLIFYATEGYHRNLCSLNIESTYVTKRQIIEANSRMQNGDNLKRANVLAWMLQLAKENIDVKEIMIRFFDKEIIRIICEKYDFRLSRLTEEEKQEIKQYLEHDSKGKRIAVDEKPKKERKIKEIYSKRGTLKILSEILNTEISLKPNREIS